MRRQARAQLTGEQIDLRMDAVRSELCFRKVAFPTGKFPVGKRFGVGGID